MKMRLLFICFMLLAGTFSTKAQLLIEGFAGGAFYLGDMQSNYFIVNESKPAMGVGLNYNYNGHIEISAGYTYMKLYGSDRSTGLPRNLNFSTDLHEIKLMGEFNLFDLQERRISPFFMAGVAGFMYNPYTYTQKGEKVFLQPLGTEGQGLAQYPDKKMYKLKQLAIPFGGGVKFQISEFLRISAEVNIRKLGTDYLDDVSTTYADGNILRSVRGQTAYELSYRGHEIGINQPVYPAENEQRGNPGQKDMYYTGGLRLSLNLAAIRSGNHYGGGKKGKLGCPANVW